MTRHAVSFAAISIMMVALGMVTPKASAQPVARKTLALADTQQQVLDVHKAWVAAEGKRDAAALRRILDDKFVVTFGAKEPFGKEAFIKEEVSEPVDPTESQTLSNESVVVEGDTAIVVGIDTLRGTNDGKPYALVGRYTTTYVLRNGEWLALAEQMVKVPQTK